MHNLQYPKDASKININNIIRVVYIISYLVPIYLRHTLYVCDIICIMSHTRTLNEIISSSSEIFIFRKCKLIKSTESLNKSVKNK